MHWLILSEKVDPFEVVSTYKVELLLLLVLNEESILNLMNGFMGDNKEASLQGPSLPRILGKSDFSLQDN